MFAFHNNTQPMLVQCAICPVRHICPWEQYSGEQRRKYCRLIDLIPVIEPTPEQDPHAALHKDLTAFILEHTN